LQPSFLPVEAGKEWQKPLFAGEKPEEAAPIAARRPRSREPRGRRGSRAGTSGPPGMEGGMGPGIEGGMGMGFEGAMGRNVGVGRRLGPEAGSRSSGTRGREMAKISAGELAEKDSVKVWGHDVSAIPGRTYRYRLRLVMFNPLAGASLFLKDKSKAMYVGIAGPWSEISRPVTIERDTDFFVGGTGPQQKTADVTIYHWHLGWLCKERFTVKSGEPIGGQRRTRFYQEIDSRTLLQRKEPVDFSTGATVVDILTDQVIQLREATGNSGEFEYRTESDVTVVVYLDDQGRLQRKDSVRSTDDASYRSLAKITKSQRTKRRDMTVEKESEKAEASK